MPWFQGLLRLVSEGRLRQAQGWPPCFAKGSWLLYLGLGEDLVTLESRGSREGHVEIGGATLKRMDHPSQPLGLPAVSFPCQAAMCPPRMREVGPNAVELG